MSGFTDPALTRFRHLLRARGVRPDDLAAQIGTTRSYVSRVLWGHLESVETKKRLHAVTTAEEWAILCTLEHFATWNTAQDAAELDAKPGEFVWLMRQECMGCGGDRRFVACRKAMSRDITHGICPACLRVRFPDIAEEILGARAKQEAAA